MITKHSNRLELLRDLAYFSNEAATRIEQLAKIESDGRAVSGWQQAAAVQRRIRSLARHQADEQRRKANRRTA